MHRLPRIILPLVLTVALTACGLAPRTFDASAPARVIVTAKAAAPSALTSAKINQRVAALTRRERRALHRWFVHVAFAHWLAGLEAAERARMSSAPWPCIATAETGGSPAMGPTFWTEYGVVVDIIEDFGTSGERAAIFSGRADSLTRWRPVSRFAAAHGFGGWGVLTKQKCGL